MAEITLDEPDREGSVLPDVCMKCGRPAPNRTYHVFSLGTRWAHLLGFAKWMAFHVPLCELHSTGFHKQSGLTWTMVYVRAAGQVGRPA
jgi:hypothetical protein